MKTGKVMKGTLIFLANIGVARKQPFKTGLL